MDGATSDNVPNGGSEFSGCSNIGVQRKVPSKAGFNKIVPTNVSHIPKKILIIGS